MLKTATRRVANLLNEDALTHQLPPKLLTAIFNLAVNHGSEHHAKQIVPLTQVCRYWRTVLLPHPRMWSTVCMKPGDPNIISEWLACSRKVPLTVLSEFTDSYEHPPCRYEDSSTSAETLADDSLGACLRREAILSFDRLLPHRSRIRDLNILFHSSDPHWEFGTTLTTMANQRSYTTDFSARPSQTCSACSPGISLVSRGSATSG